MRAEVFKPVEGFPHYQISNLARLFNTRTNKFIKGVPNGHYLKVLLCDNGRTWQTKLHILVALHFCKNSDPKRKTWVNHLCPKLTLTVAGTAANVLEWVTPKENSQFVTVSKFFSWDDSALEQSQNLTCGYCQNEMDGSGCPRCSARRSTPRDNYQRSCGGSFF